MDETRKQYKIYLTDRNIALLKAERKRTGQTTTDLINALIDAYFKQMLIVESKADGDPIENKLDDINAKLLMVLSAVNGTYRTAQYIAEIENQDINADKRAVARKKAMRSYTKLRNNTLTKEDYLLSEEDNDYVDDVTDTVIVNDQPKEDESKPRIDLSKYFG